jgi:hypothetical protein
MMTGRVANRLLGMLRQGEPAREILESALREYEGMDAVLEVATPRRLADWARELRAWVDGGFSSCPPPPHVTAICLSVNTGVVEGADTQWLRFQGHPDERAGQSYEAVNLWPDLDFWSIPAFDALALDFPKGEELAVFLTAALVRDAFSGKPGPRLSRPLDVHVRPECAGETLLVGRLTNSGIDLEPASQDLWWPGD